MEISSTVRNPIAFITLNRPAALNALSYQMILDLHAELRAFAADPRIGAVLIQGAGEKAFCAGGDVRALYDSATGGGTLHHEFFAAEYQLDHFLHCYPKPYVALMNGITMGGGMGVAQASRLRVATERTRIAMPEVGIGLFPDVGASYFLSRLPGALGTYLGLTGNQVRAADALYVQLADVYLPLASLDRLQLELSELPWSEDWRADVTRTIQALSSTELPSPALAVLRPAIDVHFSQPTVPAIVHSLRGESRPEYVEWAQETLKIIASRSPTMLAVALQQLQRGRTLNLADCFRMELGMVWQCFEQGDFIEGVRALIIDKDNTPHWNPARIEDVTDAMVAAFFKDRWTAAKHPLARL